MGGIFMAVLLSCREIKKDFGDKNILDNVSFDIAIGERIGLVGLNGAGKSTLANILGGKINKDGGSIIWHKKSVNIGYLKQESSYALQLSVEDNFRDYLYTSSVLGLKNVGHWKEERLKSLSGGEKTKLALSAIWAQRPDFLILDEPTNHLDYQGVEWLIKEVTKFKGTVIIISHDRYFLDMCVSRIIEIENKTVHDYRGNYSFYREEKKRRYESVLNQYILQEEMKKKIDEQINTLKNWSAKAHRDAPAKAAAAGNKKGGKEFLRTKAKKMDIQIKSRIKRLEKIEIEGVDKPKEERKIHFSINSAALKGSRVVEASNISKAFKDNTLFKNSSFYVQKGEKIGIFGENGCGKSTLLRLLMGMEKLDAGEMFLSSSARVGYLSQDISSMDMCRQVIELFSISSREERGKLQTLLFNMGFDERMLKQSIGSLSLGELTRLRLAELINRECDLLILDEPLNHLDIHSREKLEEVLLGFNGTIILVSHDKYMMERVCSKLLVFEAREIKRFEFGLSEYLNKRSNSNIDNERTQIEKKLLMDNEISYILGEICKEKQGTERYFELDSRFKELCARKTQLQR
jgi:macrolide transport system ATP-binding/permease protein